LFEIFEEFFLNFFCLKFKQKFKKIQIQILDTRYKLTSTKLQFEIYLVPTKPLVVPETIWKLFQIFMVHTVYTIFFLQSTQKTIAFGVLLKSEVLLPVVLLQVYPKDFWLPHVLVQPSELDMAVMIASVTLLTMWPHGHANFF
jgi:hypothetical protein